MRPGSVRQSLVGQVSARRGMAGCGAVGCGMVGQGMDYRNHPEVRQGLIWLGMVRCGTVGLIMARLGGVQLGHVWPGMVR